MERGISSKHSWSVARPASAANETFDEHGWQGIVTGCRQRNRTATASNTDVYGAGDQAIGQIDHLLIWRL